MITQTIFLIDLQAKERENAHTRKEAMLCWLFGASFCVSCPSLTTPLALRTGVGVCIACLFSPSSSSSESSLFLVCCPPGAFDNVFTRCVVGVRCPPSRRDMRLSSRCHRSEASPSSVSPDTPLPLSSSPCEEDIRVCSSVGSISTDNCFHVSSFTPAIVLPFIFLQAFKVVASAPLTCINR